VKWLVAAILLASSIAHADEIDDPRVLFAEGRYAAAAQVFEHRWTANGDATEGVNAVVAWRTAGRYARALSLLARVRTGKEPPTGAAAATATELDSRLATLTSTLKIEGRLDPNAVVRIDAEPAERLGDELVVDLGDHDLEIEQPNCDRFVTQITAYAGATLVVPFAPRCHKVGTLHVYLATEPGATFRVDGEAHKTTGHEADIELEPGVHRLQVSARDRPVYDEQITIREKETTAVRIRYPWRARKLGFVLGVTNQVRAGQKMIGTALGVTFAAWAPSFHYQFDIGSMISNTPGLDPSTGTIGRPWLAHALVFHTPRAPVWTGKLGPYRLAFDPEPLGIRFDEVRAISYAGIRVGCENLEPRIRAWSAFPVALSASGPYAQFQLTAWPVSVLWYHTPEAGDFCGDDDRPSTVGVGAFVTLTGGWRLF
jgi:hypothetical protein